ncbi:hypothetical protein A0H76_560 [Hepatospora eriocheir]|uniref:Uncharacterized protein n=1 Tax=Hepatospora eriocheir TaxID=1081669 RepID=A0A1X0Q8B0_9MICR|nr:hypothetical protein A0H76_560 [Hepatospora eriocheir]
MLLKLLLISFKNQKHSFYVIRHYEMFVLNLEYMNISLIGMLIDYFKLQILLIILHYKILNSILM